MTKIGKFISTRVCLTDISDSLMMPFRISRQLMNHIQMKTLSWSLVKYTSLSSTINLLQKFMQRASPLTQKILTSLQLSVFFTFDWAKTIRLSSFWETVYHMIKKIIKLCQRQDLSFKINRSMMPLFLNIGLLRFITQTRQRCGTISECASSEKRSTLRQLRA